MIRYFQNRYAMSEKGATDLLSGSLWTALMDLSFMAPVALGFYFLSEYIGSVGSTTVPQGKSFLFYTLVLAAILAVIYLIAYMQYEACYNRIYEESARRRISLAETLRKLPLAFFGRKDLADLSSTVMEDASQIEQLFSHTVPQLYAAGATVLLMGVMLFVYNWQLSLAVFWVIPVAALVFWVSRSTQKRMNQEMYLIKRDVSDYIQEDLDSIYEIKSYSREGARNQTLDAKLNHHEKFETKAELLTGVFVNLAQAILKLGLPSVMIAGIGMLVAGSVNMLTYIAFLVVAARIYDPITEALANFAALLYLNVRISRMREMDSMPRQEGSTDFAPNHYDIRFENVSFSYLEGVQTLNNVSFTAKQGEVTALVGPSGGGKSTVAKLAARFWDIDSGEITLGGKDIAKVDPETLLGSFSIVFQDVALFNSSVMENIRLGKKDATDAEVLAAAKLAQCDDFVKKLPQGYDTLIGENGERLSGGERQRISIARAMLKDAPIILLDEATASLDAENESKIQRALSALIRDKTVLIIAHRMRTVAGADQIVVLEDGAIRENGTPEELKAKKGMFAAMLKAQYQS